MNSGASLAVQQLRLPYLQCRDKSPIPGQGVRLYMPLGAAKNKMEKKVKFPEAKNRTLFTRDRGEMGEMGRC